MAASSSSSISSTPIAPIEIDFQAKETEACRIFTDPTIQEYALNALKQMQELHAQIMNEIREYNAGNVAYREVIDEKIKTVLKNHIAKKNFPKTRVIADLKGLKAFFSPFKEMCKRLKGELSQRETEIEHTQKTLQKEKNCKLSLLLSDEQKNIFSSKELLNHFVNKLKTEFTDHNPKPTIYFAYAWPTDDRMRDEFWVQPFLEKLQDQLIRVGLHTVRLDIVSNRYGQSEVTIFTASEKGEWEIRMPIDSFTIDWF